MTSRREFLEAAALTALPVIAGTPLVAAAAAGNKPVPVSAPASADAFAGGLAFEFILFDSRYSQAHSAAARLRGAGAAVHSLADGDITQVWMDHIGPAWQRGPAAIAGVTARPALFCLEQFALSSGMRVVFHAEHVVHADGQTHHSLLRGADRARISAADLTRAGEQWPTHIVEALARYRPQLDAPRFGRSDAALEPALPAQAQLLTSWIIAAA